MQLTYLHFSNFVTVFIWRLNKYGLFKEMCMIQLTYRGFPGGTEVKNLPAMQETGLIPASGRSPGGGNDNPLWYSCLENPMNRGA